MAYGLTVIVNKLPKKYCCYTHKTIVSDVQLKIRTKLVYAISVITYTVKNKGEPRLHKNGWTILYYFFVGNAVKLVQLMRNLGNSRHNFSVSGIHIFETDYQRCQE